MVATGMELQVFLKDFADALNAVDSSGAIHKHFQAGIGPFGEADAVRVALKWLQSTAPGEYSQAVTKRLPDLLIPNKWAIEFKIIRPFGDNGKPAEHWSENILHPYPGNTSSLGDCLKLLDSGFKERKAIVVFGFEHSLAQILLDPAVETFELIASRIMNIKLSSRIEEVRRNLIHPVHQVVRVFGWEVLSLSGKTKNLS